jgi:hypothetical protein
MGKCPYCQAPVTEVDFEPIKIRAGLKYVYPGAGYLCQRCHSVLSVGIDPVAQRAEIVAALEDLLRRRMG